MSHSLIVLSLLVEASILPSRLIATPVTQSSCPFRVARSLGSCARAEGLASKHTRRTLAPICFIVLPRRVRLLVILHAELHLSFFSRPGMSHSLMVLSALAEASILPSGLKAIQTISLVCASRVAVSFPAFTSHNLTVS